MSTETELVIKLATAISETLNSLITGYKTKIAQQQQEIDRLNTQVQNLKKAPR